MPRLHEDDARDIFRSVARNAPPPPHRPDFRVVRVPRSDRKLSPPSLDFDCGLYVLLRSPTDDPSDAVVPSALAGKVLPDDALARWAACGWSLSGPQQSKHRQIQQRYCYPRGQGRGSTKGAAIWTQIDGDGNEDVDCRLLNVYFSGKRAGMPSPRTGKKPRGKVPAGAGPGVSLGEEAWKSPRTPASFELDSHLDFPCGDLFDDAEAASATPAVAGRGFLPFVPVPSADAEDRRPDRRTAAARGDDDDASRRAGPPAPADGAAVSSAADFARKLRDVGRDLARDVRGSADRGERAVKLHRLQGWARAVAERPLQPPTASPLPAAGEEGGARGGGGGGRRKGSPGTPSISP